MTMVTAQPPAKPQPEIDVAPPPYHDPEEPRPHWIHSASPCCKSLLWVFGAIFTIAFGFAVLAGAGAAQLVLGNVILHETNHPQYTLPKSAAAIGAVGAPIFTLALSLLGNCVPCQSCQFDSQTAATIVHTILSLIVGTTSGAGAGAIGFAVLNSRHFVFEGEGIDANHMARAGALGGLLVGPALWVVGTVLSWIIAAPMMLPLLCGFEYLCSRERSQQRANSHSSSSCWCGATRGRDPEIGREMNRLEESHQNYYSH